LAGSDWTSHLPWVLLGTSVPLEGGLSPAEAVMGCQPLLPGQFLPVGDPPLEGFLEELRTSALKIPRPVSHKNTQLPTSLPAQLLAADLVLVRRDGVSPLLSQPYDRPYKVVRRSLHSFQLQMGNSTEEVSTHRLKACNTTPDTPAASPPRRGRPPSMPSPSDGAQTPYQNPGELTSTKKHGRRRGRPPRSAGSLPGTAEKTARNNQAADGERPPSLKNKTGAPQTVTAHSGPALATQMRARSGIVKRVAFSCEVSYIPQVFQATPPVQNRNPDPNQKSGSSHPFRIRKKPDRYGISNDPPGSTLGGEL
jgi:hypothetical protein